MNTGKKWTCRTCGMSYVHSGNPQLKGVRPSCFCEKPDCVLLESKSRIRLTKAAIAKLSGNPKLVSLAKYAVDTKDIEDYQTYFNAVWALRPDLSTVPSVNEILAVSKARTEKKSATAAV